MYKRILIMLVVGLLAESSVAGDSNRHPTVTSPSEFFFQIVRKEDREAARAFYAK